MTSEQLVTALVSILTLMAIIFGFTSTMRKVETEKGRKYATMLYGVWGEIFVTFFPFLIYVLVDMFKNNVAHVLQTPELAVAAAVLSGQAVLRLLHQVIGMPTLVEARERIVFLAILGLLVFLLSVVTIVLIASSNEHPWFVSIIQLALLALALPLYSALAGAAILLREEESKGDN